MTTILVSGASGVVGYGTLRSIRAGGIDATLIGTSIYPDSVAQAFCDIFEFAPKTNDPSYFNWLLSVIKRHKIDLVIPGIEMDMLVWSKERARIAESGAKILLNNPDLIALCGDKWEFYQRLGADNPYAIPTRLDGTFDELQTTYGLPFLLKPRAGFASKGIVRVTDSTIFSQHRDQIGQNLMAQPIVGDDEEEYTTSAFFDESSALCCHMTLRRKLAKDGYTEKAHVSELAGSKMPFKSLSAIFKPVGPTNFQFRKTTAGLKLLEINPRISSSTAIRAAFGYNESAMAVRYLLDGVAPTQPTIRHGHAVRYIEEHIFYDRPDL